MLTVNFVNYRGTTKERNLGLLPIDRVSPFVEPVPDFEAEDKAKRIFNISREKKDYTFVTNSSLFVYAIRTLIKEGVIPLDEVKLQYDGIDLDVLQNARIRYWPDGFCDVWDEFLERLIGWDLDEEAQTKQPLEVNVDVLEGYYLHAKAVARVADHSWEIEINRQPVSTEDLTKLYELKIRAHTRVEAFKEMLGIIGIKGLD